MILVKIMGGLGNQLFEYAFAKQLAVKHNTELKVDVSGLNTKALLEQGTVRDLELNKLGLDLKIASESELAPYKKGKIGKGVDLILHVIGKNKIYLRERSFEFDSRYLSAPKDCYLDGYWQSEKYFRGIRSELLKELVPQHLSEETKSMAEKMRNEKAVSIHVRKGDYLSIPQNRDIYGECDAMYYELAIKKMNDTHGKCSFYVFSDDQDWVERNLGKHADITYVTHNTGTNSFQDLYLMSQCSHHIIANSSFSWWGAWLNQNESKLVIAPKNWFKNNIKSTKDLIPSSWVQL